MGNRIIDIAGKIETNVLKDGSVEVFEYGFTNKRIRLTNSVTFHSMSSAMDYIRVRLEGLYGQEEESTTESATQG